MSSEPFRTQLAALESRGRLRHLIPRAGRDFASNDYLGLASDPMIGQAVADAVARGVPVGSGGSRLLRGNAPNMKGWRPRPRNFSAPRRRCSWPMAFSPTWRCSRPCHSAAT